MLSLFADDAALFLRKRSAEDNEIVRYEARRIPEPVGKWLIRVR